MVKKFGYNKAEKLKQKTELSLLFEKGKWRNCGRLRFILLKPEPEQHQPEKANKIGVAVSKRYFKKATDRNRIKRLLREAYRLNKTLFTEKFGNGNIAMLFWNSSEKPQHYNDVATEFLNLCQSKK